MGLDRVGEILRKENGNDQLPEDYKYECAWRMAQWSLPVMSCNEGDVSIEKAIYSSFVAFRDVHCARFSSAIKRGYLSVIHGFGTDSFETTGSLYRLLSQLAALTHLEECFQLRNRKEVEKLPDVVRSWSHLESLHECNYSVREPILNVETTALKLWSSAEVQCPILRRETIGRLESQVKLARENGVLQWTETFLSDLRKMSSSAEQRLWCSLEETKILWDYNEKEVAKGLLQSLIMDVNKNDDLKKSSLTANCYFYFGLWSMELRSENALVILTDYLEKAINIWKSCVKDSVIEGHLREAYLAAARFADGHYQRVSKYKKSDVYETKQQVIRSSQVAVNNITSKDIDSRKAQFQLKKQIDMDRKEVVMFETTHRRFLLKSLEYYLECLRLGHEHDSRVFRVVALWNENSTLENVNAVIEDAIEKVPSYKFLPLIRQLSARMKPTDNRAKSSRFHEVLDKIIYKVCLNHPYHTLLILLALGNASKDDKSIGRRSSAGGDEEDRVLAAQQMIERLKKTKRLSNVVTSMEKVCDALIRLSYWERKANHGSINDIDKTQPITKLNNVLNVPPFTASIPVDPTGKYDNILHIVKFGPKFKQCDGLSKPKQIWCLGSDGVERLEMIKGRDDLRQDAVMQQVFEMVNTMLKKHKETSRKGLLIRTYKVVPLSRRSGILEWCAPTKSMGQYLANDSFRKRYDPTVWPNLQCRERIKEASGRSPDERCRVYSEICESVKPVFRYFFFEEFPQPSVWYEKRNAYIKSVATSSVVGYILGLGDRHLSNILIDLSTAEVIHIDLGVSFEQGKTLSIPETVPFRLTRDIIDGMGAHGYEGTFRRCCERTLTVMRDSQEVVLTILEVLLYDPLYHWTLTPLQMRKLQDTVDFVTLEDADASTSDARADEEQVNKLAERVLHRMREKLIGQEEANTLSVAGQVSHVIREATDIRNLCMIFCGWQAFL